MNNRATELIDGPAGPYVDESRAFHDALIELSGNRTLTVIAGALSVLWKAQIDRIDRIEIEKTVKKERFVSGDRSSGLQAHYAVSEAIAEGDVERVRRVLSAHGDEANAFWTRLEGLSVVDVTSDGLEALPRDRKTITRNIGGLISSDRATSPIWWGLSARASPR